MPIHSIGNDEFEVRPYVDAAIAKLGYVKPEAAEWLAEQIAIHAYRNNGRSIREAEKLSPTERESLGLPRYGDHVSHAVLGCLTEKGLQDPVARFDATCWHAVGAMRQEAQRRRFFKTRRALPYAMFLGPASLGMCDASLAQVGKLLTEPPDLPLPGCTFEVCTCIWRTVSRVEARKKGWI